MPKQAWLSIILQLILFIFLVAGAVKFLQHSETKVEHLTDFIPAFLVVIVWLVFHIIQNYDLATTVALTSIAGACVLFYFTIKETDPTKQSLFSAFVGGLFGFGTGMPIGQRLQTSKIRSDDE